jgi:hypothetical protein
MQPNYEETQKFVEEAHKGQTDKGGEPYVEHLKSVSDLVKGVEDQDLADARIIGLLHDVVEDTDFTLSDLKKRGYSPQIVNAVDAITKRTNEAYFDYLDRVIANPLATVVKMADMEHNTTIERIKGLPPKEQERLLKKYSQGAMYLGTGGERDLLPLVQSLHGARILNISLDYEVTPAVVNVIVKTDDKDKPFKMLAFNGTKKSIDIPVEW